MKTKNTNYKNILMGAIAAFPALAFAADFNETSNYTGSASGLDPTNIPGGNWGNNLLHLGGTGIAIVINSGTLQDTAAGARHLNLEGTNNTFTFTGSSTQLIVNANQNWDHGGSTKFQGSGTTTNVLAGATFTTNGWNGFDGSSNILNIDGAGSKADFSADNNDGFGVTTNAATSVTSNRINITNGGTMYVSGNGFDGITANTAGQYTVTVDGAGGRSVLGFTYTKYNSAGGGGIAHIINGGAIETHQGKNTENSFAGSNDLSQLGKIFVDGGVISYKGASAVQMNESTAGGAASAASFTYAGNNAMRLNGSTSTDTGSYTLANNLGTKNYVRLEMINGTTSVARAITIDGANGGSILLDSTVATVTNGITLVGAATLTATGTASTLTGVIGGTGGFTLGSASTGTLTLRSANTYTGPTTVLAGVLKAFVASVANVSGAFGTNSAVAVKGGATLDLNGVAQIIDSLSNAAGTGGTVELRNKTLTVGNGGGTGAFSGTINGGGASGIVVKAGTGTETLSGTLNFNTLYTNGGITTLAAALGTGVGTATLNANATTNITVSQDLLALNIGGGGPLAPLASFGGGSGPSFGVVPEPGSMGLLLTGALGLLARTRRR